MLRVLCLAALLFALPAQAQTCWPWADLVKSLLDHQKQTPIGGGVLSPKAILQVFASVDGATFTITIVQSNGMACVMAIGTGWEPGLNPVLVIPEEGG